MKYQYLKNLCVVVISLLFYSVHAFGQYTIVNDLMLSKKATKYNKSEFEIQLNSAFSNPYDQRDIRLDMLLTAPSGKKLMLPCYFVSGDQRLSVWRARFTPQESGRYVYHFSLTVPKGNEQTSEKSFDVKRSSEDGFLHVNDYWTLRFDSGKPFRGIGENVGWESRSFEDSKWTYERLLSSLHENGANFFRTWMCVWNLPVAWRKVDHTSRYSSTTTYFNEQGSKRMDELIDLCDSLQMYFMVSIDPHGALIPESEWKNNMHNKINGGPANTPEEFFTNEESKEMYKNRLRYLVARWGYSPNIGAWEFFNEIDNAVFTPTPHDSVLIPHKYITAWHREMSAYLKSIDPYDHIVTTSVSHRDIEGMNDLKDLDINQKHIYNKTHLITPTIKEYVSRYKKPYVIGEFGYDWNWDNVKHEYGSEFDFDYKRGLWYGMFSSTPILPMTWWWEFFDERNMTPYFKNIRFINDEMLRAGHGSFENVEVKAVGVESYAVKCGERYFVYVLNNSKAIRTASLQLTVNKTGSFKEESFEPGAALALHFIKNIKSSNGIINTEELTLAPRAELVLVFSPTGMSVRQTQ